MKQINVVPWLRYSSLSFVIFVFLFAVVAIQPTWADVEELIVTIPQVQETTPGQFITLVATLENNSGIDEKVEISLALPQGWKGLNSDTVVVIPHGGKKTLFLTFIVPEHTASTSYEIQLQIQEQDGRIREETVIIKVKPVYGVQIGVQDRLTYALLGDQYDGSLQVTNLGNVTTTFSIDSESVPELTVRGLASEVTLGPGEGVLLPYQVTIPERIVDKTTEEIYFHVTSDHLDRLATSLQRIIFVFEQDSFAKNDYLLKAPALVELGLYAATDQSVQYNGSLAIRADRNDTWAKLNLGGSQLGWNTYLLEMGNSSGELSLGKKNYNLYPLGHELATGAGAVYYLPRGNLGVMAGARKDDWILGLGGEQRLTGRSVYSAGIMMAFGQDGTTTLLGNGLSYRLSPSQRLELNMILSNSPLRELGQSWKIKASGKLGLGNLSGEYFYDSPTYVGEGADRQGVIIKGNQRIYNGLNLFGDYTLYKQNLLDLADQDRLLLHKGGLGASVYTPRWPAIYLSYRAGQTWERGLDALVSQSNEYSVGVSKQLGKYTVMFSYQNIEIHNAEDSTLQTYSGKINYRDDHWQSWIRYIYQDETRCDSEDLLTQYSEAGVKWYSPGRDFMGWLQIDQENIWRRESSNTKEVTGEVGGRYTPFNDHLGLSLRLEKEKFDNDGNISSRLMLIPALDYQFTDGLYVGAEYSQIWNHLDETYWAVNLYTGKELNLPIPGLRASGDLSGIVFNDLNKNGYWDEGDQPLEGLILKMNQKYVVTDKLGRYAFPPLKAGDYRLEVESMPPGLESVVHLPKELQMGQGASLVQDLPFVEVATVYGKVYYDPKQEGVCSQVGLPGVKVLVQGEDYTYQAVTNSMGNYSLRVEPGEYTIFVDQELLPHRFTLTTEPEVQVAVDTGKSQEVNFGIYQKPREIVFTYVADQTEEEEPIEPEDPIPGDLTDITRNVLEIHNPTGDARYKKDEFQLTLIRENEQIWYPIRAIAQVLEAKVYWDEENMSVYIVSETKRIFIGIQMEYGMIDGEQVSLINGIRLYDCFTYITLDDLQAIGLEHEVIDDTVFIFPYHE